MSFSHFSFHPKIAAGIKACGFTTPTPIQEKAIPEVLTGRDILGLAQTGTGKTAAFVLPMLERLLNGPRGGVRGLIVAPTRELAEQIHADICRMGKETGLKSIAIYGGVGKQPQINRLRSGVDIVVACPGRLLDLAKDRAVNLSKVEILVLDEADHMFDMGFLPDLRRIVKLVPEKRQNLLFSATMPTDIRKLADSILRDPAVVQIGHKRPASTVNHVLYPVEQPSKTALLRKILAGTEIKTALIFTRTKHKAKNLARQLDAAGYKATSLQGNLSQQKRQEALEGFRRGRYTIMVATDIAARGIDVSGISHVINFDAPATVEAYTHRTGRTGRAELTGEAFTFAGREDRKLIQDIERLLGKKMSQPQGVTANDLAPADLERTTQPPVRQSTPRPRPAGTNRPRRPKGSNSRSAADRSGRRGPRGTAPLGFLAGKSDTQ